MNVCVGKNDKTESGLVLNTQTRKSQNAFAWYEQPSKKLRRRYNYNNANNWHFQVTLSFSYEH